MAAAAIQARIAPRRRPCWAGTPEIYFTKAIDNSRLVKVEDPQRVREMRQFGFALACLFLFVMVYAFSHATIDPVDAHKIVLTPDLGKVAVVAANLYVIFFNVSWGPVLWVMLVLTALTAVYRFVRVYRQAAHPPRVHTRRGRLLSRDDPVGPEGRLTSEDKALGDANRPAPLRMWWTARRMEGRRMEGDRTRRRHPSVRRNSRP